MRTIVASIVAFAMFAGSLAPAPAAQQPLATIDQTKALSLLAGECSRDTAAAQLVAQATNAPAGLASPNPTASPSASPSAGPTQPPPPRPPSGPEQLLPPPLPQASPTLSPIPLPSPSTSPSSSPGPVFVQRQTPEPSTTPSPLASASAAASAAPSPVPSPAETLGPNQYEVLADTVSAINKPGEPADLDGNVNVFYADGILVGDHAHYDGTRYIDLTGRPYVRNTANDTVLHADSIRFDTLTQRATLINGKGQTTQGVETGHFFYTAKQLVTERDGRTHGQRASFTTCDRPRAGYHVEAKTLDITPGDKAIARSAVLFLGGVAVFFLPIVVIPLNRTEGPAGRAGGFIPVIGYSQTEGFYVKARIGFAPSDSYYGYYRVDAYTKLGIGLGYVAFFRRKNGRRTSDVNFYRFRAKQDGSQQNNLVVNDAEVFSQTLRGQFGVNYQGNYGPFVSLPPSYTLTGSVAHVGLREQQNYTFNRNSTGSQSSSTNLGFTDNVKISTNVQQGLNVSFTNNQSPYTGIPQANTLHFNTLTHVTGKGLDYDLTVDKTDSNVASGGIDKLPELLVRPHGPLDPKFTFLPITGQFTFGDYSESRSFVTAGDAPHLTTQRGEAQLTFGPAIAHFLGSDLNANVTARQDAYGTGDLKGQITQNASLNTPLGRHFVNSITYSEQNSNGPQFEPFKTLDIIGGASHQASEVLRIFNGDVYTLSLQTGTAFNRAAQPIAYQLNLRPSPRSSLLLGGSYVPGPGQGFYQTNAQVVTPLGRGSDLQFSTNIDWKNKGRLNSKNVYYRRIIGDCYELLASYNQDLKQVTFSVEILAFPSHSLNFGLQTQGSIIPGSLNFSNGQ